MAETKNLRRRVRRLLLVVGVAAGIALRVWVIRTPELGYLDSDEAVPGLMARHFLHGEFSAFYWGQDYGGTAEVALLAAVFLLVGSHVFVLQLVPIVLYAIAPLLVWRIGRRTIGEPGATVAGLLVWLWPAYFVWRSTREYGYYGLLVVCGLTLVLLALRLRERPSLRDATGLGIALGVGWWCSPQIALVALPVLWWLGWRCRPVVRYVPALAFGATLGASPWLVANVRSGWASLTLSPGYPVPEPYSSRLHGIVGEDLPELLGLRVLVTRQWLPSPLLGQLAFWLLLAALLAVAVRRRASLELVAAIVVPFPFLAAISGYTWFRVEPRYLTLLAPFVALLVAALLADVRLAALGLGVATALPPETRHE
jgi:dolichyl-phosphate-mannose-protein mannosyltransferase